MKREQRFDAWMDMVNIQFCHFDRINEDNKALLVVRSVFDVYNFSDSLFVSSIAADAPNGIGRVKNDAAFAENCQYFIKFFVFKHISLNLSYFKMSKV